MELVLKVKTTRKRSDGFVKLLFSKLFQPDMQRSDEFERVDYFQKYAMILLEIKCRYNR